MRPAVVDWLNDAFGSDVFARLVPYPALVYSLTMLVCLLVFVQRSRQACLTPYHAVGAALSAMIGGLIGARLLYLALWRPPAAQLVSEMLRVAGGTISWGAYLGGLAGFCGYLLVRRQELLPHLDVLGSVLGLGPFLGRWACFLNGCDFGRTTAVPWAVEYPHGSIPFVAQVRQEILDPVAAHSLPVHPVQLYLSVNGLLLFVLFSYVWRSRRWPEGTIFFGYWVAYGSTRFVLEFLRGNTVTFYLEVLSTGQVMATAVAAVSLLAMFWAFRRQAVCSSSFTDEAHE
jgi:phosphatidylglycerol:prolipoprotein diacylglycerol transferase